MKSATFLACSILSLISFAICQESAGMRKRFTNQDVIDMAQTGLSEEVITAKIRAMNASNPASLGFDTTVDGIKALKAANVSDAIIKVMINPTPPQTAVIASAAPMTLDPNLPPPEVGVYWKDAGKFVLIEGQALSQTKIGGKAGSMFTYGIRGLHWDGYLNGPKSAHIVTERRPVLYLYVPDGTGPSDYSLLILNQKGNRREFQIGSLGGKFGGGKAGLKRDKEVPFQSEHLGIRTYKVMFDQDLKPGEYAFFMATGQQLGATGQRSGTGGAATGRIYDFGIPE